MNTYFANGFLLLLSSFLFNFISFGQSLEDGLLIYYNFDGNADDQSGNGYHGLINATLTEDRFGNQNKAYHFNGVNQFIDIPNVPALKPQLPVTISAWVLFEDIEGSRTAVFTNDFATDNHTGVWISVSSAGLFGAGIGDNTGNTSPANRRSKLGTTSLQNGVWYQLTAVVRDLMDIDLYINCENDGGNYTGSGGNLGYSNANGSIGRKDSFYNGPAWYFYGTMDEFRYWDRALTELEVESLCRITGLDFVDLKETIYYVNLFPNPSSDIIQFDTNYPFELDFSIISVTGTEILSISDKSNDFSIDVSNLESGIYFLQANDKNDSSKFSQILKFIKK